MYNLGGLLEKVRGYKSYGYDYVNKLGYDKFEQRSYLKYCNGAETFYTYDPARRRLSNLAVYAGKSNRKAIMDNAYTYDAVSNVLSVANNAPLPSNGAGGQMQHTYTYDNLYRLASATGTYTGAEQKTAGYNLTMAYDNMHRITAKKQHITQNNVQFDGTLNAGYDLTYAYSNEAGKKFQLANVHDLNYRTEETPNKKTENNHAYSYDKNGNLIYVNSSQIKLDGANEPKVNERKLRWDEENRLLAVDDNGFVSQYWYDADGERTVKTSGDGTVVYVNSLFSGGNTQTAKFTLYVSPYLVASQGGKYTKHIYVGSQRIVPKLGDLQSYGADPRRIPYAGSESDNINVDYKSKYTLQQQSIKNNYTAFDVPYNGKDNDNYADGQGFCCEDIEQGTATRSLNPGQNDNYEQAQFYYHPDHLGSSSFITNLDGDVTQHIEYVPFGEVFIEERNNVWNTPYLFNAKELDEETGLYYYGARYYDPRLGLWLGADVQQEKRPGISTYAYTANNPIKFIDPDGEDIVIAGKGNSSITIATDLLDVKVNASSLGINFGGNYTISGNDVLIAALDIVGIFDPSGIADVASATLETQQGNWGGALLSGLGVIPYLGDLGKAGKIPKHIKTFENAIEAAQATKNIAKIQEGVYDLGTTLGKYVGQSKDIIKRVNQHFAKGGKLYQGELTKAVFHSMPGSSKLEREVYEHYLITEKYGIKNLKNVRLLMGGRLDKYEKMINDVIKNTIYLSNENDY